MAQTLTVEGMLAMVPVRAVPFEEAEGRVTLLRPKFVSPWLRWLQNFLSKPVFRVKLDEKGSFLWLQMDGTRTSAEVIARLRERFGEQAEPAEQRSLTFLYQMMEGRFLDLTGPIGLEDAAEKN
jgi:hypothetical protein